MKLRSWRDPWSAWHEDPGEAKSHHQNQFNPLSSQDFTYDQNGASYYRMGDLYPDIDRLWRECYSLSPGKNPSAFTANSDTDEKHRT